MTSEKSSQFKRITTDELFAEMGGSPEEQTNQKPPSNVEELFRIVKHSQTMYPSQGLLEYYLQKDEPVPEWFLEDHDKIAFPIDEGLYHVAFSERLTPRVLRMGAWSNTDDPLTQPWPRTREPERMQTWVNANTERIMYVPRRIHKLKFEKYHPTQKLTRSQSEPDVYKEKLKDRREVVQDSRTDLDTSKFPEAFSITQNIFDKISRTTPEYDPNDFESIKRIFISHIFQFNELFHGMCHIIEKNPNMKRTSAEEACALLLLTDGFMTLFQDIAKIINRLWKYYFIINDRLGLNILYCINFQKDKILQIVDRIKEIAEINEPEIPRKYSQNSLVFRLIKTGHFVYKQFMIPAVRDLSKHKYPISLPKPEEISGRNEFKNVINYVRSIRMEDKMVDLPTNETVQYIKSTQTQVQPGDAPELKLGHCIDHLKRILSSILEIIESDQEEREGTEYAQFVRDVINGVQWTREPIDNCIGENHQYFAWKGNTEAVKTLNVMNQSFEEITNSLNRINRLGIYNEPIPRFSSDRFGTTVKGLIKDSIANLDQMEILVSELNPN